MTDSKVSYISDCCGAEMLHEVVMTPESTEEYYWCFQCEEECQPKEREDE